MIRTIKIAMIGESGVGKTCIINRYVKNVFDNTSTTRTATFQSRHLISDDGETEVRLMIWDTAGQEVYRSITSFYYKDADGIVLVYDITNLESFNGLHYWIEQIKASGKSDVVLTIVGNKSDLVDEEVVELDDAKALAKKYGAKLLLASAKDNVNIGEIYRDICIRKYPELEDKLGKSSSSSTSTNEVKIQDKKAKEKKTKEKEDNKNTIKLQKDNTKKQKNGCC